MIGFVSIPSVFTDCCRAIQENVDSHEPAFITRRPEPRQKCGLEDLQASESINFCFPFRFSAEASSGIFIQDQQCKQDGEVQSGCNKEQSGGTGRVGPGKMPAERQEDDPYYSGTDHVDCAR